MAGWWHSHRMHVCRTGCVCAPNSHIDIAWQRFYSCLRVVEGFHMPVQQLGPESNIHQGAVLPTVHEQRNVLPPAAQSARNALKRELLICPFDGCFISVFAYSQDLLKGEHACQLPATRGSQKQACHSCPTVPITL